MSAFLVDRVHIDLLVGLAIHGPGDGEGPAQGFAAYYAERVDPDQLGRMLWAENLRSVAYRYPGDQSGQRPGPSNLTDEEIAAYTYTDRRHRLTVAEAFKALGCYEYQSCECPDWRDSEAARWADRMRYRLEECVPGYNAAPWDWDARELEKAQAATVDRYHNGAGRDCPQCAQV